MIKSKRKSPCTDETKILGMGYLTEKNLVQDKGDSFISTCYSLTIEYISLSNIQRVYM